MARGRCVVSKTHYVAHWIRSSGLMQVQLRRTTLSTPSLNPVHQDATYSTHPSTRHTYRLNSTTSSSRDQTRKFRSWSCIPTARSKSSSARTSSSMRVNGRTMTGTAGTEMMLMLWATLQRRRIRRRGGGGVIFRGRGSRKRAVGRMAEVGRRG